MLLLPIAHCNRVCVRRYVVETLAWQLQVSVPHIEFLLAFDLFSFCGQANWPVTQHLNLTRLRQWVCGMTVGVWHDIRCAIHGCFMRYMCVKGALCCVS